MKIMKKAIYVVMALFCLNLAICAQSITLKKSDITVKQAMDELKNESGYSFVFSSVDIDTQKKISVWIENKNVEEAIKQILQGQEVSFEVKGKNIILKKVTSTKKSQAGQKSKVTGTILDTTGEPIIGANVVETGSTNGTITDLDGRFMLDVYSSAVLLVSYIGYNTKEIPVGDKVNLNIYLTEDAQKLEEVVVIGYGTVRKKDVTGSVSTIDESSFNVGIVTSPTEMMQGRIPGVNVTTNGGEPGAGASVRVRGSNSIRSGQEPLYVMDGVPLDISDAQPSGSSMAGVGSSSKKNPLNFLNPDDIESIDVLKDASATAIYGSRGANGVIIVTTKKGKEGTAKVSYSGYMALSSLPAQMPVLSATGYRHYMKENNLTFNDLGANTNWQDEIFKTALTHNHAISLSGGGKNTQYRASLSYMNQEGVIKKTGLEKYTGRFSFTQTALHERLKLDGSGFTNK